MVACHDYHVVLASEIAAILVPRAPGADYEATAVVVEHNGASALIHRRRPYIEHKAIFGGNWFIDPEGGPVRLKRRWARSERITNTGPRVKGRRCFEAILPRRERL